MDFSFFSVDRDNEVPRKNLLMGVVFIITAIVGISGVIQQMLMKFLHVKSQLDFSNSSISELVSGLYFHLIPFLIGIIAIFFVIKKMHWRSGITLFGQNWRNHFQKFGFAVLVYSTLFLLMMTADYFLNGAMKMNPFNKELVITFLILLPFVFLQTGFEELAFRAYLPQTFVGLGLTKFSAVFLASILFGLMHYSNPEITFFGSWFVMLYIFNGLFLGLLSLFEEGLGLALGFHFMNNFLSLFLISSDWQVLKVPALFHDTIANPSAIIILIQLIITFIVFFYSCYKRYHWSFKQLTNK